MILNKLNQRSLLELNPTRFHPVNDTAVLFHGEAAEEVLKDGSYRQIWTSDMFQKVLHVQALQVWYLLRITISLISLASYWQLQIPAPFTLKN